VYKFYSVKELPQAGRPFEEQVGVVITHEEKKKCPWQKKVKGDLKIAEKRSIVKIGGDMGRKLLLKRSLVALT